MVPFSKVTRKKTIKRKSHLAIKKKKFKKKIKKSGATKMCRKLFSVIDEL